MKQFYVRSDSGAMVPLDNLISITQTTTPQVISHYNLFRSAEIDGSRGAGIQLRASDCGDGRAGEEDAAGILLQLDGISLEELQAGGTSLILFGLGTLVVYLTLSAQYESFVLPFIVLLAVPMALLGALGAQWIRGLQNDVFCQVGLVMLVGLASKNAILIVEFAEQLRERGVTAGGVGGAGGDDSPAADTDDFAGVHSWRCPAGRRYRRRRERASFSGHDRIWRNDHVNGAESVFYSRAVPDY